MPNQRIRQQARRAALDVQTRMRQARAEQERRRSALAVTVVTALAERDALVAACEARAGEALRTLTGAEDMTLREAVQWCGGEQQLSAREATRLRRIASQSSESSESLDWIRSEEPESEPAATLSSPQAATDPISREDASGDSGDSGVGLGAPR